MPELPLPPCPQFGQVVPLFLDVKNDVLTRITEPSNDDYNNEVSDNCDYDFVTFDFGLKVIKKYAHNMILMSRYKGQLHDGKKDRKIWAMPERKRIFSWEAFPSPRCHVKSHIR